MADIKIKHSGQNTTESSSGYLRIEDGNNRLVLFNGTIFRLILGLMPDNSVGFVISKEGTDVFTVFS